jgi:predicted dehydrogenase
VIAGIVGFGSAGSRHAQILASRGFSVVAVRSFQGPTKRPLPFGYSQVATVGELIEMKPVLAVVSTPTLHHFSDALELASGAVPVLIEKPLISVEDRLQELNDICLSNKVPIRVAYHLRFHPIFRYIHQALSARQSKILSIRAAWGEYLPDWHPDEDFRLSYAARSDQGGGPLLTLSHVVDYAVHISGPAVETRLLRTNHGILSIDTEETAMLGIRHLSGSLSSIQLDYLTRPTRHHVEVVYDKGVITYDFQRDIMIHDRLESVEEVVNFGKPSSLRQACFDSQIDDFLNRIEIGLYGLDNHDLTVSHLLLELYQSL